MNLRHRTLLGDWFERLARFLLGGVFIVASVDKILNPGAFADILYAYNLIPDILIYPLALWLPWIEMVAGVLLVSGICVRANTLILSGMLLVFIVALTINAIRGYNIDCGCFATQGDDGGSDLVLLIIRDILLLIPAGLILWRKFRRDSATR